MMPAELPERLAERLVGPLVPIMPAFSADESLDLEATAA